MRVALSGFKTFDAPALHLQVAQQEQLDATLEVGSVTEEVSVQADVSPVNASALSGSEPRLLG
jgi:hypothetical protein